MAINNLEELLLYFKNHDYPSYDRDNFDNFLKKEKFNFDKKAIHITGTNGKGSTANYIRQIYIAHGYKVGFYNSPFFYSPLEMIALDNEEISLGRYLAILNRYSDMFDKYHLSSFEIQTFIAYKFFDEENIDIAVIEVGMGGTIDATNVLTNPIMAIITSVSLEHTYYLGKTVSEIAETKSGIITRSCKVVTGNLSEDALYSVKRQVNLTKSDLVTVGEIYNEQIIDNKVIFNYWHFRGLTLNTPAIYQSKNAAIAIEAVLGLNDVLPVSEEDIRNGLLTKTMNNRFEVFNNIVIDGAHNPEAIENMLDTLAKYTSKKIHCVFAAFRDKNIETMLSYLSRDCEEVLLTTFDHVRARTEEEYFIYLGDYNFEQDYKKAIDQMINNYPDDIILICGSLAFASVARKYIVEERK